MSDRVKVKIVLTEEIRYSQVVEMSREDYDSLLAKLDSGSSAAGELISAYLDPHDIHDSYVDDVDEFEIVGEVP